MSICAGAARADNALDLLPAGGLIIERRAGLSIDAEELRIGQRGVHVSYVFANRGTRDVRSKVAFSVPLPVCDEKHAAECAWILPLGAGPNPTRFKVFVDGEPKPFRTDQHLKMRGGIGSRRL